MARLPKPPGQRVERGAKGGGWRTLPPAKPFKRPPAKRGWLASTKAWWNDVWDSPMASTYLAADMAALVRLAGMVDARSRGELGATETASMVALEDRFGLNPKSRRALQWEIGQHQAEPAGPTNVPKLRVVDDGAA